MFTPFYNKCNNFKWSHLFWLVLQIHVWIQTENFDRVLLFKVLLLRVPIFRVRVQGPVPTPRPWPASDYSKVVTIHFDIVLITNYVSTSWKISSMEGTDVHFKEFAKLWKDSKNNAKNSQKKDNIGTKFDTKLKISLGRKSCYFLLSFVINCNVSCHVIHTLKTVFVIQSFAKWSFS